MDINEASSSSTPKEDSERTSGFYQRNPLEIGASLRNLVNRGVVLTVEQGNKRTATRLLDVDFARNALIFEEINSVSQNSAVLSSHKLFFHALLGGVRVEFATGRARQIIFQSNPTFEVDFPPSVLCVQRREYFRVHTPVVEPYLCNGTLPDGELFSYEVHDLSLSGVALRTHHKRVAFIAVGSTWYDVTLQLGPLQKVFLNLTVASYRQSRAANGEPQYIVGLKFAPLPDVARNSLQRLIVELEMKRRSMVCHTQ